MRALAFLVLLLVAAPAAAQAPDAYGVHVGLDEAAARPVVTWFSRAPMEPEVRVTDAAGAEVGVFRGASSAFPAGAGHVQEVALGGLAPGTAYRYEVAGTAYDLRVPPANGSARLAFIGDMGRSENAAANVARLAQLAPAAVFHAGDISYAEGDPNEWDAWFAVVEPVASTIPWLPALGNHETYNVPGGFDGALGILPTGRPQGPVNPEVEAYRTRFALPANELSWSWRVGNVHVAAIDTFWTGFEQGGPQAAWLAADLAAAADADWRVVLVHAPPFSSNAAHGSQEGLRAALAPVLEAGRVDLVVTAHDHSYERTWPLLAATPAGEAYVAGAGVVYVVSGGGGAPLYTSFEDPQPAWSAMRAAEFHVLVVDANATALAVQAVRPDGAALDAFTIEKPRAAVEAPPPAEPLATPLLALAALVALALAARARRR